MRGSETGLSEHRPLTTPQGDQAEGNLLKVVDQARAFAGAPEIDL